MTPEELTNLKSIANEWVNNEKERLQKELEFLKNMASALQEVGQSNATMVSNDLDNSLDDYYA